MFIASRISDAERIKRYKSLKLTPEEEKELCAYDKAVEDTDKPELEFDATADEQKVIAKMKNSDTRKAPTAYKFKQRQRRPNATKGGIIAELSNFLATASEFEITNLIIANAEKKITFTIGDANFTLDLIQNRKK